MITDPATPLQKAMESLALMWANGRTASVADVERMASTFGCDRAELMRRYNAYCKGRPS